MIRANNDNPADPLPPHDFNAEAACIAAMAVAGDDRVLFNRIRRLLWGDAFYSEDHAILFRTMCQMADAGKPIDSVTLRAELKARGIYEEIGGTEMLANVMSGLPTLAHGVHYAGIVARKARDRETIRECNALVARLMEPHDDGGAIIQRSLAKLWKAVTAGRELNVWRLSDAVQRFVEIRVKGERKVALLTGVDGIDRDYLGVLTFGGYTLVAARPSMGKSTFVRWLLTGLARAGTPVGLIAVEENEDKIAGNVLSSVSEIENNRLAYGRWDGSDADKVADAAAELESCPFYGIDSAFTLTDILTAAEMLVTQHGCKVVAVDHVHLVSNPGSRAESQEQRISEISNALKQLFKRLGVSGVVAAQLSRPGDKVACPPPPHLTDLRGSGALEEHADAVLMLHRQDYYFRGRDGYTPNGLAQVLIRKNRNGCVGEVVLRADLEHQRFIDGETAPAQAHDFDAPAAPRTSWQDLHF